MDPRAPPRDPWQPTTPRSPRSPTREVLVDGAAAVVRVAGGRVGVVQIEGDGDPLRKLLAGARSLGETLTVLNLPVGHPAGAALAELGGRVDIRQHEMVLTL